MKYHNLNVRKVRGWSLGALSAVALIAAQGTASASSINVFVGYADGLRGVGFFPNPWQGDPNVTFVGTTGGGDDAGAIRIDNTGSTAITIDDINVTLFGGASFDLWGSNPLGAGKTLIVTETGYYNFDTSDYGSLGGPPAYPDGETAHAPHVDITVDGTALHYLDTGHVLDTGGYDYALTGNESFQWRPIGTTGTSDPGGTHVPDSTGLEILVMGLAGLAGFGRLARRTAAI
jgi:hypothetical protein